MGPPPTPPPPRSPQKPKWAGAVLLRGKTAFHKVVWVKRYVVVDRALGTLKLYKGAKAPAAGAKARSALPLNSCALNLNAQGPKKSDALTLLEFASQERFTLSAPVGHGGLSAGSSSGPAAAPSASPTAARTPSSSTSSPRASTARASAPWASRARGASSTTRRRPTTTGTGASRSTAPDTRRRS